MLSFKVLSWALLLVQPCIADIGFDRFVSARLEQENRHQKQQQYTIDDKAGIASCNSTSCYRYYNSKTKPYFIEAFPDVNFPTGEFYGGEVPINASDPSRTLFFIFKPSQGPPVKEVTIWLNGGPGCSSLVGFFQENGPILWQVGTEHPMENPYAWSKLTNLLWVEQPVGTGFAQGKVEAKNEVDVAKDFVGFFKNWQTLFGIKNYKIYLTGESYAGRYVPYIGAQMLDQKDKSYFNLKGALMYDPCIGDCNYIQGVFPTYYFSINNNEILNFNASTLQEMQQISETCGFNDYLDKYLQFPPPGVQPPEPTNISNKKCGVLNTFYDAVGATNPCFNVYHITDYCPLLYDPVGNNPSYFNRTDVKKAIHAPLNVNWKECGEKAVFIGNIDHSPDSNMAVLPQVIEGTNRVLVGNADWDALVYTNGTMLAIQNMTWNGHLGFQSKPSTPFVVPSIQGSPPQGTMGKMHYERGLQWVETYQSGHMQPQYQPRATWRHLQWLLGRIPNL